MKKAEIIKCKLILLGNTGVGKTSMIQSFIYSDFSPDCKSTIGIDFFSKSIVIDEKNIRLLIWDTAGQERFHCLTIAYLRDVSCAILVFDVSSRHTFDCLNKWDQYIKENNENEIICAIFGNKTDCQREISYDEAKSYADDKNISYFEGNAKTGLGIDVVFNTIASALLQQRSGLKKNLAYQCTQQQIFDQPNIPSTNIVQNKCFTQKSGGKIIQKITFLGDSGVGKTQIISKIIFNTFSLTYFPTIGIDFITKEFQVNDVNIRLQFWDKSTIYKSSRSLIPNFIKDSNCSIIVFDVTNRNSFNDLDYYFQFVKEEDDQILIAIFANKIDDFRIVSYEEGKQYADKQQVLYFEVSVKIGSGIEEALKEICQALPSVKQNHHFDQQKTQLTSLNSSVQIKIQNKLNLSNNKNNQCC